MTSFIWEQKPYLRSRILVTTSRCEAGFLHDHCEPDIEKLAPDARLIPAQTQTFTYPDGPRDSEAIA